MAEVRKCELKIEYFITGDPTKNAIVTVNCILAFTEGEAGKNYHLRIHLYGEDKPGDEQKGPLNTLNNIPIFVFRFGNLPFALKDFKTVEAVPGEHSYEFSQEVSMVVLDEDKGLKYFRKPAGSEDPQDDLIFKEPFSDEIYAIVSISDEMRSETIQLSYSRTPL